MASRDWRILLGLAAVSATTWGWEHRHHGAMERLGARLFDPCRPFGHAVPGRYQRLGPPAVSTDETFYVLDTCDGAVHRWSRSRAGLIDGEMIDVVREPERLKRLGPKP